MPIRSKHDRRTEALAIARANLEAMTPKEDLAITAAAEADPDSRPMTDEEFAQARRGRRPAENPKRQVTLRLDPDVIEALKAEGPGWQTRANARLREALGLGS
ncbi:BrnA antitoxin family protein [Mangrovicella endophytica]|uniref:BrnA antitoxin family protein n=1 Tax=Mangrovicella endophytica TaxID=2066697 RepID=UPI001FDF1612|nr:BrnA antitoxin family protein [Mangrovicella endophytica]